MTAGRLNLTYEATAFRVPPRKRPFFRWGRYLATCVDQQSLGMYRIADDRHRANLDKDDAMKVSHLWKCEKGRRMA